MDHLNKAQLESLRGRLEQESVDLQARIAERSAAIAETGETDLRDIEDKAAREAMRFQEMQLLAHDRARAAEVEAALGRMAGGSYGICEESGEPISFRRLEIDPATRYTAEAQEQLERERELGLTHPTPDEPIAY
jgi:DnaK suppressor protein